MPVFKHNHKRLMNIQVATAWPDVKKPLNVPGRTFGPSANLRGQITCPGAIILNHNQDCGKTEVA
jgi:hypothetical protein